MPSRNLTHALLLIAGLLSLVACGVACYLWYVTAMQGEVIGCDGSSSFDCDAALASKWSKWLGLPVSALGAACYATLAAGALLAVAGVRIGWRLLEAAILAAVGAGLWFFLVQATALDAYCLYCLGAHSCGFLAALLVAMARHVAMRNDVATPLVGLVPVSGGDSSPRSHHPSLPPPLGLPTLLGSVAVAALIIVQVTAPPPAPKLVDAAELPDDFSFGVTDVADRENDPTPSEVVDEPTHEASDSQHEASPVIRHPNGSRKVQFLGGKLEVDVYRFPVLGSPEAPHIVLELMDYTCPHCRKLHTLLDKALEAFDGQVAICILPVPAELFCNPYIKKSRPKNRGACRAAKLTMAVAELEPSAFASLHDWMLQGDRLPAYTSALLRARESVDQAKLSMALRDEEGKLARQIRTNAKLIDSLRAITPVGLPTQIIGDKVVAGPPESLESLYDLWAEHLGAIRPATEASAPVE